MKLARPGCLWFLLSCSLAILTSDAHALTGRRYLSETKVPLVRAREIALKVYPGKIVSQELEKEPGGSGLRYSFVIQQKNKKHEVGVDAKTGEVLENSIEEDSD